MAYVFANDGDTVIWADIAADRVAKHGVKETASHYGVSEGKLRQFLNANGWHGKRSTSWQKQEPVPAAPGAEAGPF